MSRILERQVKIAVKLSPVDGSRFKKPPVDPKAFNKVKLASQWAREAGHILNASGRCVSCGLLCVGSTKSIAYLEACLHLPCLGSTNSGDLKLHQCAKIGSDWRLCHGLKVHSSHTIASHFGLKVHFCTRCGHFGPPGGKSPGLKAVCKPPSKTGKQALRNIRKGLWPAYKGKVKKKGRQQASPKLGLGRFAKLFRQRRLRCALDSLPFQSSSEMRGIAQAERSSPGAVSSSSGVLSDNSLPLGSDHANSVAPPGITQEGGSQLISVRTFGHIEDLRAPIQVLHGSSTLNSFSAAPNDSSLNSRANPEKAMLEFYGFDWKFQHGRVQAQSQGSAIPGYL